jgi:hypothetical protein
MRYATYLAGYAGPIAPGWRARVDSDIHAWIACLAPSVRPSDSQASKSNGDLAIA